MVKAVVAIWGVAYHGKSRKKSGEGKERMCGDIATSADMRSALHDLLLSDSLCTSVGPNCSSCVKLVKGNSCVHYHNTHYELTKHSVLSP
jgi:hypothetical protein